MKRRQPQGQALEGAKAITVNDMSNIFLDPFKNYTVESVTSGHPDKICDRLV